MAELWPCRALRQKLRERVDPETGKCEIAKPAVIITTGAMNPVHSGHLAMMESASRHAAPLFFLTS
jgi:hypothetical protein